MRGLFLIFVALFPQATQAQEIIGQINGTLQGYERIWFVTTSQEGGQSSWGGDEEYAWVGISGHTAENTVLETTGAIWLSFELIREAGGFNVLAREIAYYRTPNIMYISQSDKAEIQVTAAEFSDGELQISGKFAGTLGRTPDSGQTIDMSDNRRVEGVFDAKLLLLE